MCSNRVLLAIAVLAVVVCFGGNVQAAALSVPVGSSSLFDTLDYSDSFTINIPGTNRPDDYHLTNDWGPPPSSAWYSVETAYNGLPAAEWGPHIQWHFMTGEGTTADLDEALVTTSPYPGNQNNSGAGMGLIGGWDTASFAYGARGSFFVQVDAIPHPNNAGSVQISAFSAQNSSVIAGSTSPDPGSLTVFFRTDGVLSPTISLYNPNPLIGEYAVKLDSIGIPASDTLWHNYAVHFDIPNRNLTFWVDEVDMGTVNLDDPILFWDGTGVTSVFTDFKMPNAYVGAGGYPIPDRPTWIDNFQVGGVGSVPLPIPGDTDWDRVVDGDDADILATYWQQAVTQGNVRQGDFNNDGWCNDLDATILAANWGDHNVASAVPEPSTAMLLGAILALGLFRRRTVR